MALRLQYKYGNTLVNCLVGMDKKIIKLRPEGIPSPRFGVGIGNALFLSIIDRSRGRLLL